MAFFSFRDQSVGGEELPREIQALLASYREALPDSEPRVNFMPELWKSIESRRRVTLSMGRIAKGFVTAAAAICLLMTALVVTPPKSAVSSNSNVNYLDVLSAAADDPGDIDPTHGETL